MLAYWGPGAKHIPVVDLWAEVGIIMFNKAETMKQLDT